MKIKDKDISQNKGLKTIFCTFIIIVFLSLFIVCTILWISQKYIFFHPRNDITSHEQLQKNPDFEEVNIVSDGKILN